MDSYLKRVVKLLDPPVAPIGLDRTWRDVENAIGIIVPRDYKQFIDKYGSGVICQFVNIWNFRDNVVFNDSILNTLCGKMGMMQSYQRHRRFQNGEWPQMFPQPQGLLPFATMGDVNNLCWITPTRQKKWGLVYWDFDNDCLIHCVQGQFTQFLAEWLEGKLAPTAIWRREEPCEFMPLARS